MLTDSTSSSLPSSMHHSIDADSLFGTDAKLSYDTPFHVQDYHVTFFWKSLGDLSVIRDLEKAPGPVSDPAEVSDGGELEKNASAKTHGLTGKGNKNGTQRSGTLAEFVNPMDISKDLSCFPSDMLSALSTSQEEDLLFCLICTTGRCMAELNHWGRVEVSTGSPVRGSTRRLLLPLKMTTRRTSIAGQARLGHRVSCRYTFVALYVISSLCNPLAFIWDYQIRGCRRKKFTVPKRPAFRSERKRFRPERVDNYTSGILDGPYSKMPSSMDIKAGATRLLVMCTAPKQRRKDERNQESILQTSPRTFGTSSWRSLHAGVRLRKGQGGGSRAVETRHKASVKG